LRRQDISSSNLTDARMPFHLSNEILILDGGFATELERRGYDVSGHLWSAQLLLDAPEAVEQLHYDYFAAGADCVISGSYQASYEGFAAVGLTPDEVTSLLRLSVTLAQTARARYEEDVERNSPRVQDSSKRQRYVAASVGPYGATLHDGSEYHGNYGLTARELREFHAARFAVLADSGADVLACETVPSLDEARALTGLLREHAATNAWLSFASPDGANTAHGEPLIDCARILDGIENIIAVGVNCVDPRIVSTAIEQFTAATEKPIVVYANSGEKWDPSAREWRGTPHAADLAELAPLWVEQGAQLVGGCCRTGPSDIAAIAAAIKGNKIPA
jgi:homocysteine S-methyltransferase